MTTSNLATRCSETDDAVRAIKFMAVKAAIFILVPLLAALIAVWWRFG